MSPVLPEVLAAWTERVAREGPLRALVLVAVALVVYAVRARTTGSRLRIPLVALLTVGAVVAAAERASRRGRRVHRLPLRARCARSARRGAGRDRPRADARPPSRHLARTHGRSFG